MAASDSETPLTNLALSLAYPVNAHTHYILILAPCLIYPLDAQDRRAQVGYQADNGAGHGCSRSHRLVLPAIAPGVPAAFSRRRSLRRLSGRGSLGWRFRLPALSNQRRAVPLR